MSPEEANRIAYELAMKFTGGQHQFVVATHVDKKHIHTHIEFNSTNINCDGKFKNVKSSYLVLRRLNDDLCRAHGLSVIEHPKERAKPEGEAAAIRYGVSFKEQLRQLSQEYASLLAEKQEQYAEYRTLRQDMIDYRTMKQNVDKILGLVPEEQE